MGNVEKVPRNREWISRRGVELPEKEKLDCARPRRNRNRTGTGARPYKTNPPTPLSGLLKKPHRGSAPNFTPPLRGSRRGRAVCAKADSVGGKTFLIAIPNSTPHRFACGLTPLSHRLPLKGGVKFKSTRATKIVFGGFFNNLLVNGLHSRTAPIRGGKGGTRKSGSPLTPPSPRSGSRGTPRSRTGGCAACP